MGRDGAPQLARSLRRAKKKDELPARPFLAATALKTQSGKREVD
jgi:hypothetical protein